MIQISNVFIDIDSVTIKAGINYCDWINLTKQKLKERAAKLLKLKIEKIECIVDQRMNTLNVKQKFAINNKTIDNINKTLYDMIDEWKGVNVAKVKRRMKKFRDYFVIARSWWDLQKRKVIGTVFWLEIFKHIENFIAAQNFQNIGNLSVNNVLMLNILNKLFHANMKYCNTKIQPIISGGTIMHSHELHTYLLEKHDSLDIKKWMHNDDSNKDQRAKDVIIHTLRMQITEIVKEKKADIIHLIYNNNNNNNNNNQIVAQSHIHNVTNLDYMSSMNNMPQIANIINQPRAQNSQIMNHNNYNVRINNLSNNITGHIHDTTYRVSDIRYSPLFPIHTPLHQQRVNNPQPTSNSTISCLLINLPVPTSSNFISFQ